MSVLSLVATVLMEEIPEFLSRGVSPFWIPIAGTVFGTAMVVAIVAIVVHHRQQLQRMEYEMELRRMDHARRMKELELELVKAREGRGVGASG